jgi:hypothetical protein
MHYSTTRIYTVTPEMLRASEPVRGLSFVCAATNQADRLQSVYPPGRFSTWIITYVSVEFKLFNDTASNTDAYLCISAVSSRHHKKLHKCTASK